MPPPGSEYDAESKKVVMNEHVVDIHENDDERLARILIEIANRVTPGIIMEYDAPSKNADNKMPILDMKVWMEETSGNILFQHYEKPTASGNILHANSAQAVTCRRSVHTQEIMRRLLNSSPMLNWESCVAPVISQYMLRMMKHGYPQQYRVDTLNRALRIYDHMVEADRKGDRPLYRPKSWNIAARRKEQRHEKV